MESKPDKEAIKGVVSDLIMDAAISRAIEDRRELLSGSMKHFLDGGKVNGELDIALKTLMRWVENKTAEAIESFSASQNSELKKENEELRKRIAYLENHTKYCLELDLEEKDKEIERLKGLIEQAFKDPYKKARVHPSNNMNKDYEQFKTENNL